jgi:uncharacterized protein
MVAVSDTSPLSNLAIIGRLNLLQSQFTRVLIPASVRSELARLPDPAGRESILEACESGWIACRSIANSQMVALLAGDLDRGEAEAIVLAMEVQPDVLLIDEREGRAVARRTGLAVRGVLGVLLRAKTMGRITSVSAEIRALRDRAGFFIASELEAEVLRSCGEIGLN